MADAELIQVIHDQCGIGKGKTVIELQAVRGARYAPMSNSAAFMASRRRLRLHRGPAFAPQGFRKALRPGIAAPLLDIERQLATPVRVLRLGRAGQIHLIDLPQHVFELHQH